MSFIINFPTPDGLVGNRAKIIPLETSHYAALWELISDDYEQIFEHYSHKIRSLADLQTTYNQVLADTTQLPFVIIDQNSNKIVGATSFLDIQVHNKALEIGRTWLHPKVWATHLNTECKYLLLKYCFEVLKTVRVQIKTDLTNVRSQRAIEKIGATREGVLRAHIIREDETLRDSVYYSILATEWKNVKEKLEQLLIIDY